MSGDIDISSGGIISVSSESLRTAAARAVSVGELLRSAQRGLSTAQSQLECLPRPVATQAAAADVQARIGVVAFGLELYASMLARAADVYEVVELRLSIIGQPQPNPALTLQLVALLAKDPSLQKASDPWVKALAPGGQRLNPMLYPLGFLPPVMRVNRQGFPLFMSKTIQPAPAVQTVAPTGAYDLVKAIPRDGQVRVEKYTMPDGSNRYVISVSGTRTVLPLTNEPFDMGSNTQMYLGEDASSLEAIRLAMEDAGVKPGDWVMLNAHSQAAMAGGLVVAEKKFGVDVLVSWGDPTERPAPADVTKIDITNTTDPVSSLLGGAGYPITTGSGDSFEVTRETGYSLLDPLGTHMLDEYATTAALIDASADPRLNALTEPLAELQGAESVTVTEYEFSEMDPIVAAATGGGALAAGKQSGLFFRDLTPGVAPLRPEPPASGAILTPIQDDKAAPWMY